MDHIKSILALILAISLNTLFAQHCNDKYANSVEPFDPIKVFDISSHGWLVPGVHVSPLRPNWSYFFSDCQNISDLYPGTKYLNAGDEYLINVYPASDSGFFFLLYANYLIAKTNEPNLFVNYMNPSGQLTGVHILPSMFNRGNGPWGPTQPTFVGVWHNELLLSANDSLFRYSRYGQGLDSLSFSNITSTVSLNDSTLVVVTNTKAYTLDTNLTTTDSIGRNYDKLVGIDQTLYGSLGSWVYKIDNNYLAVDSVQLPYPANSFTKAPNGLLIQWYDSTNDDEVVVGHFDTSLSLQDQYNTQIGCSYSLSIASNDSSFAISGLNVDNKWFIRSYKYGLAPVKPLPFNLQILSSNALSYTDPIANRQNQQLTTILQNNGTDTIRSISYTSSNGYTQLPPNGDDYTFTIYQTKNSLFLLPGDTMHLVDTYHYFDDNSPTVANTFTILAVNNTLNHSCTALTAPLILGVDDPEFADLIIDIYPNPTTSKFTLTLPDQLTGSTSIELYDLMGKQVWSSNLQAGNNKLELDSRLSSGVYIYHVKLDRRSVKADRLVVVE